MPDPKDAFARFLERTWREDVRPLLLEASHPKTRETSARGVAKAGAAFGLLLDGAFRLRGKPFTRAFTTFGGQIGAMLPDAFDWKWFRAAEPAARQTLADRVAARAAALELAQARELLGIDASATPEDLRRAWHDAAARWHPDRAATPAARDEYHLRFIALQAAYERLRRQIGA